MKMAIDVSGLYLNMTPTSLKFIWPMMRECHKVAQSLSHWALPRKGPEPENVRGS